jgi:hypothetical protein
MREPVERVRGDRAVLTRQRAGLWKSTPLVPTNPAAASRSALTPASDGFGGAASSTAIGACLFAERAGRSTPYPQRVRPSAMQQDAQAVGEGQAVR